MNVSTQTKTNDLAWGRTLVGLARHYLGGRRGLMLLAAIMVSAALYLNWGWLAAVGAAPILLAIAPCAAMCALGLCMNKMGGQSCTNESSSASEVVKHKGA